VGLQVDQRLSAEEARARKAAYDWLHSFPEGEHLAYVADELQVHLNTSVKLNECLQMQTLNLGTSCARRPAARSVYGWKRRTQPAELHLAMLCRRTTPCVQPLAAAVKSLLSLWWTCAQGSTFIFLQDLRNLHKSLYRGRMLLLKRRTCYFIELGRHRMGTCRLPVAHQ
jgi:hypothetical protein